MELHHDVHPAAHGLADAAERLEGALEIRFRYMQTFGLLRIGIEWPDLHGVDALLEQRLRELVGPVEEGLEVLVGAVLPFQPPVRAALLPRIPDVAIARAGVVGTDRFAARTAQHLVELLAAHLAVEVPQRDVEGRDGPGLHP